MASSSVEEKKVLFLSPGICKLCMMPRPHECAIVEPKGAAYKKVNNTSLR